MTKLEKMTINELSKEQMNEVIGGVSENCATCTPRGGHVDSNDMEDIETQ